MTMPIQVFLWISSVQFSCSVVSNSLWHHGLQHARPPCPSPTPGVYLNSYPSSQWGHPTMSSPSPPSFNLSKHQGFFKWVNFFLHQVAKVYVFIYLNIHKQCYSSQGSIWLSFFLLIIFFATISWITSVHSASKLFLHYGIVLLSVSLLPWIDWRQYHYYLFGNAIL